MSGTTSRLLRLLSLLQTRREWTGAELAERLEVSGRTVRKDVERLRDLGYPVHATRGAAGGYQLGAGADLPPLLLDDEEAVAVAIGLRAAASGSVSGIEDNSLRALAKLEQVLPSRLRHRVTALQAAVVPAPGPEPAVEARTLTAIAAAIRDHEQLRFTYQRHDGTTGLRRTEPHWIVHTGRRWYLVTWDIDRADWRTFRVDRLTPRVPTGPRFAPRQPPEGDVAAYLERSIDAAKMRFRARVRVHAPAEAIVPWVPASVQVSPLDEGTCLVVAGSDSPHMLAVTLAQLDVDFEVMDAPEVVEHLLIIANRFRRAVSPGAAEHQSP